MKVLHDWDRLQISRGWAKKRGTSLYLYWLSRKFTFLNKINSFRENKRRIENEQVEYMEMIIKLDLIAGIESIFGIRDEVREVYGKQIDALKRTYDIDIRKHIHFGESPDPNRKRVWDPPLEQSRKSWNYDSEYIAGNKLELAPGELPIWHIDQPQQLVNYIDFIYEEIFKTRERIA